MLCPSAISSFVPWRFLDAGQVSLRSLLVAGVQKPAHLLTHAVQQQGVYSISLSALKKRDGGTLTPIAFAVLRLITSSNLVGCSTGYRRP